VSRPPWWAGLAAAEAQLDCGGQPHRLRWADGQLHALDHTSDLEGEQILSALGGQSFPCLDVLDLWTQHAADLRVLILASRGPADPLAPWTASSSSSGRTGYAGGGGFARRPRLSRTRSYAVLSHSPPDDPGDGLPMLIGLGGPLPDRLAATVIATWAGRLRGPADAGAPDAGAGAADADELAAARPALHAALYGRAVTALRSWTGQRDLAVALTMIPENQPPRLARDGDGIAAELPFGWLADVWARGLATCWGRFCLAASPQPSGDGWLLSTVGPELDPPRPVTLSSPPG
jgi:hypothetical protein